VKETTEKTLFDTTSAAVMKLEADMTKAGWTLTLCRTAAIYTFEREIPEPPPAKPPSRLAKECLDVDDGFRLESGRIIS
jgi:hypothetical protein